MHARHLHGFLSQLPHSLIQSFTTLEDVVHLVGIHVSASIGILGTAFCVGQMSWDLPSMWTWYPWCSSG